MSGILYIVATPIGNLGDITLRALEILKLVDFILAEDTRVTAKLLALLNSKVKIQKSKIISYHQHSSEAKKTEILAQLSVGKNIALVTDAGTPGVSDPGNELIDFLLSKDPEVKIVPVPGPSAVTTALSVCGFKAGEFIFLGYAPKKGGREFFNYLKELNLTGVFFDSPYRILKTLDKLVERLGGDRRIFVGQELTKMHERCLRGNLKEVREELEKEKGNLGRVKGEIVVVLAS